MKFWRRWMKPRLWRVMTKADWIPDLGPLVIAWWGPHEYARFFSYVVIPVGAKPEPLARRPPT